jgi:hypothetical protein
LIDFSIDASLESAPTAEIGRTLCGRGRPKAVGTIRRCEYDHAYDRSKRSRLVNARASTFRDCSFDDFLRKPSVPPVKDVSMTRKPVFAIAVLQSFLLSVVSAEAQNSGSGSKTALPSEVPKVNRFEIVSSCIQEDKSAAARCAEQQLALAKLRFVKAKRAPLNVPKQDHNYDLAAGVVTLSPKSNTPASGADEGLFKYNSFVTRKDVDWDEDWKDPSGDTAPPGYAICGYRISEASNINSSWRTKE